MSVSNLPTETKAETIAARRVRFVGLEESLKNSFPIGLRNLRTAVADCELKQPIPRSKLVVDQTTGTVVFGRIANRLRKRRCS